MANRYQPMHERRIQYLCDNCGKHRYMNPYQFSRANRHYCSKECRLEGKPSPVTDRAIELFKKGKTLKEISNILNNSLGTTCSLIYRHKLKKQLGNRQGEGKCFVKSRLPKHCELCGYDRCLDIAHIIPRKEGGKYSLDNCLALCPNCHHLFDHGLLTDEENLKIKEIINAREISQNEKVHGNVYQ